MAKLSRADMVSSTSACLEWLLRPETVAGIRDGAPDYAQLASRLGKLSAVYAGMPGFCAVPLASAAQIGQAAPATSAVAGPAVTEAPTRHPLEARCSTAAAVPATDDPAVTCTPAVMTPAVQLDLMRQELLKRQLDHAARSRTSPPAASVAAASIVGAAAALVATTETAPCDTPAAGPEAHAHAPPVSPSRPVGPKALPAWALVGAAVEGRWKQGSQWYGGKIVKIDNTGPNPQFSLRYVDGDLENKMPISRVRPAAEKSPEEFPVAHAPISAGANVRVWETRNNLPPALRELLSFNSKGMGHGDHWDVVSTRDRKKTSIYTYTDTDAPVTKERKRKGSAASSDSTKSGASAAGSRSHKKKKTPSTSAVVLDSTANAIATAGSAMMAAAPPSPSLTGQLAAPATDAMTDSDDEPITLGHHGFSRDADAAAAAAGDLASQQETAASAKLGGRRKSQYTMHDVFSCRYCNRQFNHRGNCSSHEATHQNFKPPPPLDSHDPSKPYMCHLPHCHKAFGRISDHDMHFRSHREEMKAHVAGLKKVEAARLHGRAAPSYTPSTATAAAPTPPTKAVLPISRVNSALNPKPDPGPEPEPAPAPAPECGLSKQFKCCICDGSFNGITELNAHEMIHYQEAARETERTAGAAPKPKPARRPTTSVAKIRPPKSPTSAPAPRVVKAGLSSFASRFSAKLASTKTGPKSNPPALTSSQ